MIVILVLSIFYVSFYSDDVNAEDNSYCIEKTTDGRYCVDSSNLNNLAQGFRYNQNTCSETSFCKTGCCIDDDTGSCSYQSIEKFCSENEGRFIENDALCFQDNVCNKGCCVVGNNFNLKTEKECILYANDFGYENYNWYVGETEQQCVDRGRATDRGCCVAGDGLRNLDYSYTTRENCNENFYQMYCSQVPGSVCRSNDEVKCGNNDGTENYNENIEDVYSYDSCGLPSGLTENCDYPEKTICGYNENNIASCIPIDCSADIIPDFKAIDDTSLVSWNKEYKLNGESWCIYEGKTGDANDLVGSRHYVGKCVNGKFGLEECEEKRNEICVQNDVINPTSASCRPNFALACLGCNNNDNLNDKKSCCTAIGNDCSWFEQGGVGLGICSPNYPIGTLGKEELDGFKIDCTFGDKKTLTKDWTCDRNCFCQDDEGFASDLEKLCRGLGDFGYKYNIAGERPQDFFVVSGAQSHKIGPYIVDNIWKNFDFYKKSN